MTDSFLPFMRVLVVATLLVATATLMLVVVNTARVAGASPPGAGGAYATEQARIFRDVRA